MKLELMQANQGERYDGIEVLKDVDFGMSLPGPEVVLLA
jgi:hypothetical protein